MIVNRKQRRSILRVVGDPVDFGIALNETFEPYQRLTVIAQIQWCAEFVQFLGPLQGPTAVVVLQYPLAAPVEAGDREAAEQGGAQDLD